MHGLQLSVEQESTRPWPMYTFCDETGDATLPRFSQIGNNRLDCLAGIIDWRRSPEPSESRSRVGAEVIPVPGVCCMVDLEGGFYF